MPACAHCGLPAGGRGVEATIDGERARFCCYGCVLAQHVSRAGGDDGRLATVTVRLIVAGFLTANVLMVSMPSWVPAFYGAEGTDGPGFVLLRWLALLLGAPVIVLLGWPILATVGRPARLVTSADGLIVLGAIAAWTLSFVHVVRGQTEIFVETACLLLVFVTIGRLVEARARAGVGRALGTAEDPAAMRARRRLEGRWEECRASELRPGDRIRVGPGESFPTDGVVLGGDGGMSEAILTGEARAVPAHAGSRVAGGATSIDGTFDVRVTAAVGESARARIERLVREAMLAPSPGERLADRAATILVPAATLLALGAGAWWWHAAGVDRGVMVALAVLVVACPCALGVATPAAVATALARAARAGVLVRGGTALERLGLVECVVFDKTGTLTEPVAGTLHVSATRGGDPDDALALAAAVERAQPHPIARMLVREAEARGLAVLDARDVRLLPGRGVTGLVDGRRVDVVGRGGGAGVDVLVDDRPAASIALDERPRPSAAGALAALAGLGVEVRVLSGDRSSAALASLVAPGAVGLGLTPTDKVAAVRALAAERPRGVAMVGDGLNDAPTLAAAAVGVAVGSATDLARRAADVVLLADDLDRVPWLLGLARRTRRVLAQNLAWAALYNGGALAAAAAGALSPIVAAAVMLASSVTIVANSRRLGRGALPRGSENGARGVRRAGEGQLDDGLGAAALPAREGDASTVGLDYLPTHR